MSTTQQRQSSASGKLSTVSGLSQARTSRRTQRARVARVPSRPNPANGPRPAGVALPALVKRVQSYLDVGRT
ncbi:MAG TPA: hypothetical protein VGN13_07720 [Solirubrobacteraceae bacterium]|jgi:hypothetical protein